MDNISNPSVSAEQHLRPSKYPLTVSLDADQYKSYQAFAVDIIAPDGTHLDRVGRFVQKSAAEMDELQLHNQVVLLEYLCNSVTQDTELPAQAICGLTDVFCKMRHYLEKHAE